MDWNRVLSSRQALALAAAIGVLIVVGVWAADEPPRTDDPPKPEPPPKAAPAPRDSDFVRATQNAARAEPPAEPVITNEELSRLAGNADTGEATAKPGGREKGPAPSATPPPGDAAANDEDTALDALERERAEELRRAQLVQATESELETARKRLADLEVQLLAARNPFARRPELSAEEQKKRAETNESAAERVARTQQMVEDARAEIAKIERRLAELRAGG